MLRLRDRWAWRWLTVLRLGRWGRLRHREEAALATDLTRAAAGFAFYR